MKSSISVVLFFLLSGFFLSALLGALERSRKFIALAVLCGIAVVCVIVFLTPVQLPNFTSAAGGAAEGTTIATIAREITSAH